MGPCDRRLESCRESKGTVNKVFVGVGIEKEAMGDIFRFDEVIFIGDSFLSSGF